ncbi:MAG: biopolymer transporter ExbD [Alphaproteobacteria bacterium]|nr:biopolymer transporter ExbD [Alphaproteobacteria bacterium]
MAFLFRRKRRKSVIKSEVNLTPLIDVMTSLLAIFMITAPLLTTGIPLDLPNGDGKNLSVDDKTLDLSVDKDGTIFMGKTKINKDDLLVKLKAVLKENPNIKIVISADKGTAYGNVIELMAFLRVSGYAQVGLKTDISVVHSDGKRMVK